MSLKSGEIGKEFNKGQRRDSTYGVPLAWNSRARSIYMNTATLCSVLVIGLKFRR